MGCLPELLRLKARHVLCQGGPDPARALRDRAMQLAQRFQLRSWELRIAIDEAVFLRRDGKPTEAIALLTGVMAGFPEPGGTPDWRRASSLLDGTRDVVTLRRRGA